MKVNATELGTYTHTHTKEKPGEDLVRRQLTKTRTRLSSGTGSSGTSMLNFQPPDVRNTSVFQATAFKVFYRIA